MSDSSDSKKRVLTISFATISVVVSFRFNLLSCSEYCETGNLTFFPLSVEFILDDLLIWVYK